jgi:hypothetical protein
MTQKNITKMVRNITLILVIDNNETMEDWKCKNTHREYDSRSQSSSDEENTPYSEGRSVVRYCM